jgi:hypothetical protein
MGYVDIHVVQRCFIRSWKWKTKSILCFFSIFSKFMTIKRSYNMIWRYVNYFSLLTDALCLPQWILSVICRFGLDARAEAYCNGWFAVSSAFFPSDSAFQQQFLCREGDLR